MVDRAIPARIVKGTNHASSSCVQYLRGVRTRERRKNRALSSDQMRGVTRPKARSPNLNPR